MIKNFIVYKADGEILRTGTCPENDYFLQATGDELLMEGTADSGSQYIMNGSVVTMPTKPEGEYQFDYKTKTWVFNSEIATLVAYAKRNQLLKEGPDRISPLWWASMTISEQAAWAKYRQDLLDVPQQPGFPANIVWPVAP